MMMSPNCLEFLHRLDWTSLLVGAVVALPFEVYAHVLFGGLEKRVSSRRLRKEYGFLARSYVNYQDGNKPTGGSILLEQEKDGTFTATGCHANGSVEWTSLIRMSLDVGKEDTGEGDFMYREDPGMFGHQWVRYIRMKDMLHVRGINETYPNGTPLLHI